MSSNESPGLDDEGRDISVEQNGNSGPAEAVKADSGPSTSTYENSLKSNNTAILGLVYDDIARSLFTDVALQMHRMIKTGIYPLSDLCDPTGGRSELYPEIYTNKDPETEMGRYAVFYPDLRKRRRFEDIESKRTDETAPVVDSVQTGSVGVTDSAGSEKDAVAAPRPQQQTHLDIWGRNPPKEPKDMVPCTLCGRQVNTLRYAPHLDKCMGIGTTVRLAAMAASGFVPNSSKK